MAIANNNTIVIDLPTWEVMQPLPAASGAGMCMCNDRRGSNRFIYLLQSTTSFWRYDVQANTYQQLASPPGGTVGVGTDMTFDPSKGSAGYVWALISNGVVAPTFQYYDCAANAWTSRSVVNLGATMGTDSSLAHTCSTYNGAGNDDLIYLIGNVSTTFYRFTISTNTWDTGRTVQSSACGAGCGLHWMPGVNTDRIYRIRGANQLTMDYYSIVGNSWTTHTYYPTTETFTTGTMSIPRNIDTDKIFIQLNITQKLYALDIGDGTLIPQATEYLIATGATHVGNRLCYVEEANGIEFLYLSLHTSASILRTALIF